MRFELPGGTNGKPAGKEAGLVRVLASENGWNRNVKTVRKYAAYVLLIAFLGISTCFVYWPRKAVKEGGSDVTLSDLPATLGKWSAKELAVVR